MLSITKLKNTIPLVTARFGMLLRKMKGWGMGSCMWEKESERVQRMVQASHSCILTDELDLNVSSGTADIDVKTSWIVLDIHSCVMVHP